MGSIVTREQLRNVATAPGQVHEVLLDGAELATLYMVLWKGLPPRPGPLTELTLDNLRRTIDNAVVKGGTR